jgi:hypothetical protein
MPVLDSADRLADKAPLLREARSRIGGSPSRRILSTASKAPNGMNQMRDPRSATQFVVGSFTSRPKISFAISGGPLGIPQDDRHDAVVINGQPVRTYSTTLSKSSSGSSPPGGWTLPGSGGAVRKGEGGGCGLRLLRFVRALGSAARAPSERFSLSTAGPGRASPFRGREVPL